MVSNLSRSSTPQVFTMNFQHYSLKPDETFLYHNTAQIKELCKVGQNIVADCLANKETSKGYLKML